MAGAFVGALLGSLFAPYLGVTGIVVLLLACGVLSYWLLRTPPDLR